MRIYRRCSLDKKKRRSKKKKMKNPNLSVILQLKQLRSQFRDLDTWTKTMKKTEQQS